MSIIIVKQSISFFQPLVAGFHQVVGGLVVYQYSMWYCGSL